MQRWKAALLLPRNAMLSLFLRTLSSPSESVTVTFYGRNGRMSLSVNLLVVRGTLMERVIVSEIRMVRLTKTLTCERTEVLRQTNAVTCVMALQAPCQIRKVKTVRLPEITPTEKPS